MKRSEHMCARCGVAAHWWHGGWKHATGRRAGTSCGRTPTVVDRGTYERNHRRATHRMNNEGDTCLSNSNYLETYDCSWRATRTDPSPLGGCCPGSLTPTRRTAVVSVDDIQVGLAMAYADQGKTLAGRLDLLGAGIRDHTFRSAVETAATGVETAMRALDELITADGRFT